MTKKGVHFFSFYVQGEIDKLGQLQAKGAHLKTEMVFSIYY